jgi:hypothetical protein
MIRLLRLLLLVPGSLVADEYRIHDFPLREEMKLLVNGIAELPDNRGIAMSTTRGKIWILRNPLTKSGKLADFQWSEFASGLHRPTSVLGQEDSIIVRQRNETTALRDRDGDGLADQYRVADRPWKPREPTFPFRGMVWLETPEPEGLFEGQYLGGSRGGAHLSRLSIVNGTDHAMYIFQKGLRYPVDALARLEDGSLIVAQSNRSDPKRSRTKFALQRVFPETERPFEILNMEQTDSGFRLRFTKPLLVDTANAVWSYKIESLGDNAVLSVKSVKISDDESTVDLICDSAPRPSVMYHIACEGVWSLQRDPVRNPSALFIRVVE